MLGLVNVRYCKAPARLRYIYKDPHKVWQKRCWVFAWYRQEWLMVCKMSCQPAQWSQKRMCFDWEKCHQDARSDIIDLRRMWGRGYKYDVIYIQENVGHVRVLSIYEERVVWCAMSETNGGYIVSKAFVSCSGRLLETIKGLLQTTHITWMMRITETQWLMHVNSFMKIAMKEGIMDIQLMNGPWFRKSNGEHYSNGA